MNKLLKVSAITALTFSLGAVVVPSTTLSASAKKKSAKVIRSKKMKKTAYHANGGYIYSSAKLTKKSHKAFNYLKTTFYATKSVTVKKTNGKTATYYYIKNSKGNVKGYIWKGNLKKINTKALAQRKADIKHVLSAIRSMSTEDQSNALDAMKGVTTSNIYDTYSLSSAIDAIQGYTAKDGQAALQVNASFKGRFSSTTNAKLAAFSSQLADTIAKSDDPDDDYAIVEASQTLVDTLSDAVEGLR
ncbi:hypothetical protein [Levilactobacillus wangkuiensis]|uniref:hypothetical protein n=1 Tax=Levilactobacillus wangkuiensis TaxID=2799566 RepID=UPI0019440BE4|nr:hypothetical protein [Levilactobacillus wangkuiensis]